MKRRPLSDASGAAAIEFALVAPIFLTVVVILLQAAIAFERWNAAQMVTGIAARCIAIAAPPCTTPVADPAADPGITYTVGLADRMGAGSISSEMVSIENSLQPDGIAYTFVTITVPVAMLGTTLPLRSTGAFPRR